MEAEVVRMTIDLFNGDEEACGSVSSALVNCKPLYILKSFYISKGKDYQVVLGKGNSLTMHADDFRRDGELSDGLQGLPRPGPRREGCQEAQHGRPLHGARRIR